MVHPINSANEKDGMIVKIYPARHSLSHINQPLDKKDNIWEFGCVPPPFIHPFAKGVKDHKSDCLSADTPDTAKKIGIIGKMVSIPVVLIILITSFNFAYATAATVINVNDGDTLDVDMQSEKVNIRLYGIDAPESGQHGSVSSSRFLLRLALGHPVNIEVMGTDIFGRTLAIVSREGNASSINATIVANGYAWVNPGRCRVDVCKDWKGIESQARKLKLGIWSGFDLVPPWKFKEHQER